MTDQTYATLALSNPLPHVIQVTLNRPEVANAFNTQMATDLMHCFEQLALEPGDHRCIVLTGAGELPPCQGPTDTCRLALSKSSKVTSVVLPACVSE